MADMPPAHIVEAQQGIDAADVDEGAVANEADDGAAYFVADAQRLQ